MERVADFSLAVYSSSHLIPFDPQESFRKHMSRSGRAAAERERGLAEGRFAKCLSGVSSITTFGGLTLAPVEFMREGWGTLEKKSGHRKRQVSELERGIRRSNLSNCLLVGGTNDFKWFIVREGEGKPVSLAKNGLEVWGKLKGSQKLRFNPRKHLVLGQEARQFILGKVQDFVDILVNIFKNSRFSKVFISSLLERRLPGVPYLEIYFAHINCFMEKSVHKLNDRDTVKNVLGQPIAWFFVNVADQFYLSENPEALFRESLHSRGGLVHRHITAMEEICFKYMTAISQEVVEG